jgi:CHAT domain-containing protein
MADPVFQQRDARALDAQPVMVAEADSRFSIAVMNAMEETMGGLQFNRLPLTGDMAEGLHEIYEGKSDVYTGLKASKKSFVKDLGPELENYGRVVFGTHGFFSKNNPHFKEPVLVLTLVPVGTDGFLRMSEVTGLKLNSDVVALTACQTGLGKYISGEGTMGMGRAFQYAGARSVLTSLWSVSETSSVKLVENFFKHIKEGRKKIEALKLARADIRQEGFDHPFFWASFILVGEGD